MCVCSHSKCLGFRLYLTVTAIGAAFLLAGCSDSPGPVQVTKTKLPAFLPQASPETLAADAADAMSQLGAKVIRNDEGAIRSIVLTDLPVSDSALLPLRDLPDLEVLSLTGTRITNTGMTHLTGLERLTYLFMNNTDVTDQGLLALADSVALRYISLDNTSVTSKGVEEFRKLSPGTVVQHSPRQATLEQLATPWYTPSGDGSEQESEANNLSGGEVGRTSETNEFGTRFSNGASQIDSGPTATGVRLRYKSHESNESAAGEK